MTLPKTRLSTAMSGSARETEGRLRNLFIKHRRPALALVMAVGFAIGLCGSLVACRAQIGQEQRLDALYDAAEVSFDRKPQREELACIQGQGGTLVAGHFYDDYPHYALVIGVEDDRGQLTGPVFSATSSGGRPQVSTFRKDDVDYLLYTVNGGGQGTTYGEGGLLAFDGTDFTWVWPMKGDLRQEDAQVWVEYQNYWEDRIPLPCPGGVEIFQGADNWRLYGQGSQWSFRERLQLTGGYHAPERVMNELRRVLEDRTKDQDNPWQASNTSAQWQIVQVTPGEETLCGQRYTLLACSALTGKEWLGMEALLCPTFWSGEEQLWPNLIRVVTGSEEEVRQALSEGNRQVETQRITMTTATGRNLSLELELEPLDQQPYCLAIEQIRVYEGDTPLQFMAVEDDMHTPDSFYRGLFLIRDSNIGAPDVRDLNFDGSPDLGLLAESSFPHNVSYVWFLWDEETSRFSFSTYLFSNPTLDEENQQVVERIRGDAGRPEEAVYVWTEDGTLEQISYRQLSWS